MVNIFLTAGALITVLLGNIIIPTRSEGEMVMNSANMYPMLKRELMKTIGNNVYKYRTEIGLTQEELAEKVGIGGSFIARIECGQKIMSVPVLYKLAQTLHVSLDMLLSENTDSSTTERLTTIINNSTPESISKVETLLRTALLIIES